MSGLPLVACLAEERDDALYLHWGGKREGWGLCCVIKGGERWLSYCFVSSQLPALCGGVLRVIIIWEWLLTRAVSFGTSLCWVVRLNIVLFGGLNCFDLKIIITLKRSSFGKGLGRQCFQSFVYFFDMCSLESSFNEISPKI